MLLKSDRHSRRVEDVSDPEVRPRGLEIRPHFTDGFTHPFDLLRWTADAVEVRDDSGRPIFREAAFEAPESWSARAREVVCSKYCHGAEGAPDRERSAGVVVDRVCSWAAMKAQEQGYFRTAVDARTFVLELTHLCINQYLSFNSPVWFNVGHDLGGVRGGSDLWRVDPHSGLPVPTSDTCEWPVVSACYIQPVKDSIDGIMALAAAEARVFKYGSGSGSDLSTLRSTRERVSGGGRPSGPVSFMRIYDAVGAVIKSGGKTRRAAKIQTLRCDHPDILEFVRCKDIEEDKVHALIAQGYPADFNGPAYSSALFQNSNLSVRVTDRFMELAALGPGREFPLLAVTTGEEVGRVDPSAVLDEIARVAWRCGDPALQYHDEINRRNPTPSAGEIRSSNPCSEYHHINNSACNILSLDLRKFVRDDGSFDVESFVAACRVATIAMDAMISVASYPTPEIAATVHRMRQIGVGYANLGGFLMARGIPYDWEAGREWCAALTSLMAAAAHRTSAELAGALGPYATWDVDGPTHLGLMHEKALAAADAQQWSVLCREACEVMGASDEVWRQAIERAAGVGMRNSQLTLLAPTGTIAFMMDCDTLGIEPEVALVKTKSLAGGGTMHLASRVVAPALAALRYAPARQDAVLDHLGRYGTVEDAMTDAGVVKTPLIADDLPVFDCAFPAPRGALGRSLSPRAHLAMMAAAQPFLCGAISKTVNLPTQATVADVRSVFVDAWKLRLKSVTVYRDGSKGCQPLTASGGTEGAAAAKAPPGEVRAVRDESAPIAAPAVAAPAAPSPAPRRERLPDTRDSLTHHFTIASGDGEFDGYLTVGYYPDGRVGEVFLESAKGGSALNGLLGTIGTLTSMALQYGVPLEVLCRKFAFVGFEPSGPTKAGDVPFCKSLVDYVFRWIGVYHLQELATAWRPRREEVVPGAGPTPGPPPARARAGRLCAHCGGFDMVPNGANCYVCMNCYTSSGGCGG